MVDNYIVRETEHFASYEFSNGNYVIMIKGTIYTSLPSEIVSQDDLHTVYSSDESDSGSDVDSEDMDDSLDADSEPDTSEDADNGDGICFDETTFQYVKDNIY